MGLKPYYLGDTSAVARIGKPAVAAKLRPLIESGLVARCTPTDLEAGYSARNKQEHRQIRAARAFWPLASIGQATLDRAHEVQALLAARSQHRGAKLADLLIAAAAEATDLVVLHYDADFDLIASVTGQAAEWVVPAGSCD